MLVGVILLVGVVLQLVGTEAQMGEDTGDVVVHGCCHPLVLLCEVGVVCEVLANMVLLLAHCDTRHNRVLVTRSMDPTVDHRNFTYLGVVESLLDRTRSYLRDGMCLRCLECNTHMLPRKSFLHGSFGVLGLVL